MVERRGHTAHTACDGVEAVELLMVETYDYMLLDLTMPRMSGEDVVRWLLQHPGRAQGLRVVIVSAWAGERRAHLQELGGPRSSSETSPISATTSTAGRASHRLLAIAARVLPCLEPHQGVQRRPEVSTARAGFISRCLQCAAGAFRASHTESCGVHFRAWAGGGGAS
ncbi:response regulator [Pedococcus sp. P5_B7]